MKKGHLTKASLIDIKNVMQTMMYNDSIYLINPTSGVYFPIPNVGGIAIRRDNIQIACTYLDVRKSS